MVVLLPPQKNLKVLGVRWWFWMMVLDDVLVVSVVSSKPELHTGGPKFHPHGATVREERCAPTERACWDHGLPGRRPKISGSGLCSKSSMCSFRNEPVKHAMNAGGFAGGCL